MKGNRVGLREVAKAINSPEAYTSKILQQLTKHKLINSEKGPNGGFMLDERELEQLRLSDIVTAIDGEHIYKGCALGLKRCNKKIPCSMHHEFISIRGQLKEKLESTTIRTLAHQHTMGLAVLKR